VVPHDLARLARFHGTGCNQLNWAWYYNSAFGHCTAFFVPLFCCTAFCCTALFLTVVCCTALCCTACRCRRAAGLPLWLSQSAKELSPWCRAPPREQQQQLGQPKVPPDLAWHLDSRSATAAGQAALLVLPMKPMKPLSVSNWACFLV
jgi:hypothetical protein